MTQPDAHRSLENYRVLAVDYDASCMPVMSIREEAVALLCLQDGDVVIDVASGTGLSFPLLIKEIGDTGHLIAIEHSPEMMAIARERVAAAGWSNVTLIESAVEAAEVPLEADALLFHCTHDVLQSPKALAGLFARAKPDARVAIVGAKFTSWWLAPLNLWVMFRARLYLTTYSGLQQPWRYLLSYVPDLAVRPYLQDTGYVANGRFRPFTSTPPAFTDLRLGQVVWLAAAVFVVSAGYGALLPLLPGWLSALLHSAPGTEVSRHVGLISGAYAAGILAGAPLWGVLSDRVDRGRILLVGLAGFVASLLLMLVPGFVSLTSIYTLRAATGFFVAAVIPVVSAVVAEHTPEEKRARRFAWLGGMTLLGFFIGPGLTEVVNWLGMLAGKDAFSPKLMAPAVVILSALFGAVMMIGLARTLPTSNRREREVQQSVNTSEKGRTSALWWLNAAISFVIAGFEVAIVLQGQRVGIMSSRHAALMLAICSLTMLGINGLLFFTTLLEKIAARVLMGTGLIVAAAGLTVLAINDSDLGMYSGVGITAAGAGLILPIISYLAAGVTHDKLGTTMGSLAAAVALGQMTGSAAAGWLFSTQAQRGFGWLILPLVTMLIFLKIRPHWWSGKEVG